MAHVARTEMQPSEATTEDGVLASPYAAKLPISEKICSASPIHHVGSFMKADWSFSVVVVSPVTLAE